MTESQTAVIVDRGFQKYEGPRIGRRGATRAIIRDGVRRVLGLRRKARRKIFPWALIISLAAGLSLVVILTWAENLTGEGTILDRPYVDFISIVAALGLLFAAYAGPELLAPDRSSGMLSLYFTRPLSINQYLLAKGGAFAVLILGFWLIPQLIYHLAIAGISQGGFFDHLQENLDVLWQIPLSALGYMVAYGAVALLFGAWFNRAGMAAATCVAFFYGSDIATSAAHGTSAGKWLALFTLEHHAIHFRDRVFGYDPQPITADAGFGLWVSVLALILVAGLSWTLIILRYRRPV